MNKESALERVRSFLRQYDPSLVPLEHEQPTRTSEDAALALKVNLGQIAKAILFRSGQQFGLIVAAGDVRICNKKVRSLLGGGKTSMAKPEEVEQVTGYSVGGVCPFDIEGTVPIYLDQSMQRFTIVYTAAGTPHSLLPISLEQLQAITGGLFADIEKDA